MLPPTVETVGFRTTIYMRDKARIKEILHDLEIIWNRVPDYRFFQLLNAIGFDSHADWFYLEDDKLKSVLNEVVTRIE